MILTWMPPRKIRRDDSVYPLMRHWLVDEVGRILATVVDPMEDNPEDSFDARLMWTMTDDTGYFISLEHAQAWCVRRALAEYAEETAKDREVAEAMALLEVQK